MSVSIFEQKFGSDFKTDESLSPYTTVKLGGKARYFLIAKETQDLIWAVKNAQELSIPYFILGGGSNTLVSDTGYSGLVIKNETAKLVCQGNIAIADSGLSLSIMLKKLAEMQLGGLEFLAGIPGTIGGAVCGNAGAWGKSMADVVISTTIIGSNGKTLKISNKQIGFDYRETLLKKSIKENLDKPPVILSVQIKTNSNTKEAILRISENYIKMRQEKQPQGFCLGSVFKNIILDGNQEVSEDSKLFINENIIPAGLVFDRLGFRGKKKGKIQVSDMHANFVMNLGKGKCCHYYELICEMQKSAKIKYGLKFKKEISILGDPKEKQKGFWGIGR